MISIVTSQQEDPWLKHFGDKHGHNHLFFNTKSRWKILFRMLFQRETRRMWMCNCLGKFEDFLFNSSPFTDLFTAESVAASGRKQGRRLSHILASWAKQLCYHELIGVKLFAADIICISIVIMCICLGKVVESSGPWTVGCGQLGYMRKAEEKKRSGAGRSDLAQLWTITVFSVVFISNGSVHHLFPPLCFDSMDAGYLCLRRVAI